MTEKPFDVSNQAAISSLCNSANANTVNSHAQVGQASFAATLWDQVHYLSTWSPPLASHITSCNSLLTFHQVANRNSLSVRMDEIHFDKFIYANIGFFAASYLVFYPAELLKTRQQVCYSNPFFEAAFRSCVLEQVSRHVHAGSGRDPYSVRGLIKDL
jgi:hypothetical protein